MRDLSIRGAGDILGQEQSGFIDSIGIDLYLKILNEEVDKINNNIEDMPEDENSEDAPSLEVTTHIEDSYVDNDELKIEIHKIINRINSFDTLKKAKQEIEDRFGKMSEELTIYMYEELFESMKKEKKIEMVKQSDKYIEIIFNEEFTNNVSADELFVKAYKICRNFKLSYRNKRIILTLIINNLDRHWIYYIVDLLQTI